MYPFCNFILSNAILKQLNLFFFFLFFSTENIYIYAIISNNFRKKIFDLKRLPDSSDFNYDWLQHCSIA